MNLSHNQQTSESPTVIQEKMTSLELRSAASLGLIFFLRMFGLFLILPVLSLYTDHMQGATPFLIGLALGIYGLTQASFQIPFGWLSDRIGRKPVITLGLIMFMIGSMICALSDSITWLIIGRALQGSGAIAASVMALASDLTRESQRTKAMAIIGISIGVAFTFSFIAGPVFNAWIGLSGLFWMGALVGLFAIIVLYAWVPTPEKSSLPQETDAAANNETGGLRAVLHNSDLLRLDASILILHLVLTASFVVLPLALRDQAGIAAAEHWKTYLPVMLLAIVIMAPFIRIAEKRDLAKPIFVGAIGLLGLSQVILWQANDVYMALALMLLCFFTAFNYLEAALPSLVSRTAPKERKGTALGVYSTSQFLGAFIGGALGGWLSGVAGLGSVFLMNFVLIILWFLISLPMQIRSARH